MEQASELVKCPKCSDLVNQLRLKVHLKKVHSPEAEAARESVKAEKIKQKELGSVFISCDICKTKVRKRNLISHCKKAHELELF